MILVDYNQLVIAQLFGGQAEELKTAKGVDIEKLKSMVFFQLSQHQQNFASKYGKLVVCCDGKSDKYWRKHAFVHYKSNREAPQSIASIEWTEIFKAMDEIRERIRTDTNIPVLRVERAEADDIIAVLTKTFYHTESIMIVSADKDFGQLHLGSDTEKLLGTVVRQYSPIQKKMIECPDPKELLYTHIIKGDRGDGVPNILSGSDWIVKGTRQKSVTKPVLEKWLKELKEGKEPVDIFTDSHTYARYIINEIVIDFKHIPKELVTEIIEQYMEKK